LKNIIQQYESELKVHAKVEIEMKDIIKNYELKLKERDNSIKLLDKQLEVREQVYERSSNTRCNR
jgi:hypothetical protein